MPYTTATEGRYSAGAAYGFLIVLLTVTIQFGTSVYASVQFCAFLILSAFLLPVLVANIKASLFPIVLGGFGFYLTSLFYINSSLASHDLLRSGREFICFLS